MYQRDRGEMDWDQRSVSSSNILSDTSTLYSQNNNSNIKSHFYSSSTGGRAPSAYEKYLANGPNGNGGNASDIELSRFDSRGSPVDQLPLLAHDQQQQLQQQMQWQRSPSPLGPPPQSTGSLPAYQFNGGGSGYFDNAMPPSQQQQTPPQAMGGLPRYPPGPGVPPYPQQAQPALYDQRQAPLHRQQPSNGSTQNLAGRGAHRN